jgi:hypothetical protein
LRQRDRGLARRVAAADHEHVAAGEIVRSCRRFETLSRVSPGTPELAEVAGPADRHDHARARIGSPRSQ